MISSPTINTLGLIQDKCHLQIYCLNFRELLLNHANVTISLRISLFIDVQYEILAMRFKNQLFNVFHCFEVYLVVITNLKINLMQVTVFKVFLKLVYQTPKIYLGWTKLGTPRIRPGVILYHIFCPISSNFTKVPSYLKTRRMI